MMNEKECSSCGCPFPPTTENFSNDASQLDGLNDRCKICESDRWSIHYYNNHEKELQRNKQKYNPDYYREYRRRKRQEQRIAATA